MSAFKTALVTGSSSGIGRAVALQLAAQGLLVIVTGRNAERGQATVDKIKAAGGNAVLVVKDLSTPTGPTELAKEAEEAAGAPIDILINNASGGFYAPADQTTSDGFSRVFDLNTRAPCLLTAALVAGMAERGSGIIVNVSAAIASMGQAGMSLLAASKAALESMTRSWAVEYGPRGVRVNCAQFGAILHEDIPGVAAVLNAFTQKLPTSRPGTAEEAAGVIVFLCSPASSYMNGAVVSADGGAVILSPMGMPETLVDSENVRSTE